MTDLQSQTDSEKEWWEKKKESIRAELMDELDEEDETASLAPKAASRTSDTSDDTVLVESGGPVDKSAPSTANKKKKGKK